MKVLCVRLAGWAENDADGVSRVKEGLDELAAALGDVEVCTLDVRQFSNASDDACAILTGVFSGLPCCWISREWDQQHEGRRWDLPPPEQLAANGVLALEVRAEARALRAASRAVCMSQKTVIPPTGIWTGTSAHRER